MRTGGLQPGGSEPRPPRPSHPRQNRRVSPIHPMAPPAHRVVYSLAVRRRTRREKRPAYGVCRSRRAVRADRAGTGQRRHGLALVRRDGLSRRLRQNRGLPDHARGGGGGARLRCAADQHARGAAAFLGAAAGREHARGPDRPLRRSRPRPGRQPRGGRCPRAPARAVCVEPVARMAALSARAAVRRRRSRPGSRRGLLRLSVAVPGHRLLVSADARRCSQASRRRPSTR